MPHAFTCRVLGVSASWFYKWIDQPPTPRQARRAELDAAVNKAFKDSKGTYGSPRIHADLVDPVAPAEPGAEPARAWRVSVNTVADSMRRQGRTWRRLREELQTLHVGQFTGNAGQVHQRTELTAAQRDILRALQIAEPPRFLQLTAAD